MLVSTHLHGPGMSLDVMALCAKLISGLYESPFAGRYSARLTTSRPSWSMIRPHCWQR